MITSQVGEILPFGVRNRLHALPKSLAKGRFIGLSFSLYLKISIERRRWVEGIVLVLVVNHFVFLEEFVI